MANDKRVIGRPFRPGQSGNPRGRPRGSRHRLSEQFLAELCEDWTVHGKDALDRARQKDPVGYCRIVASLVPRQVETLPNPLQDLTDDELDKLDAFLETIREDEAAAPQH